MINIDTSIIEEQYKMLPSDDKARLFYMECSRILASEKDDYRKLIVEFFDKILEFFGAQQVYMFAYDDDRKLWIKMGEKYADNNDGQVSQRHVDADKLQAWYRVFEQEGMVIIPEVKKIRSDSSRYDEYEFLADNGVENIIAVPLVFNGQLRSFLGVDNSTRNIEYVDTLYGIGYFLAQNICKHEKLEVVKQSKIKAEESYNILKIIEGKDDYKGLTESVLHGVSELYYAIYCIDFKTHSYVCFRESWNNVRDVITTRGDYIDAFSIYIENYIYDEDKKDMYDFSNYYTLAERLKDKKSISHIYRRKGVGWTRGQYVVSELDKEGKLETILYTVTDINEEKELELKRKESEYKATHDDRTGMLNRTGLYMVGENHKYKYSPVIFMLVDIAMFERNINQFGKDAGREILKKITECLDEYSQERYNIAYMGGDVFALLYVDNEEQRFDYICRKTAEMHNVLSKYDRDDAPITINVGVVRSLEGYSDEVMQMAYTALYTANNNGRGNCVLIDMDGTIEKEWYDSNIHLHRDNALANSKTGTWSIEFATELGEKNRMYGDKTMKMLIGVPEDVTPEEMYELWYKGIELDYRETVFEMFDRILNDGRAETTYQWVHPTFGLRNVRGGGSKGDSLLGGKCIYGYHQDLMDTYVVKKMDDSALIMNAMMKAYFCNYYINLIDETYSAYNNMYIEDYGIPERGNIYEAAGEFINDLVEEESKPRMLEFMDISTLDERLKNVDFIDCEFFSVCDKGWCRATFIPVRWDKEKQHITHVMFVIAGIDEMKAKELELQRKVHEALIEAENANSAKTEFLSRMSHDIRTPMNAILGMTAIARANIDDQVKVKENLSKINVAGKHLLSLINEVLDMRKIESGAINLQNERFNLVELLDNIILMMRPEMNEHRHTFNVGMGKIEHELVRGDTLRIRQILINILSNAIKYTPEEGEISLNIEEIACDKEGKARYQFAIQDNGIGMSEEFLEHIFEPFARADDTRTNKIQGTGLGLTIVNSLVMLMDGDIKIDSEKGKGSRFVISVELELQNIKDELAAYERFKEKINYSEEISEETNEVDSLREVSYKGKRALVVEDQEFNREIAEEFLMMAGLAVECAENGKEAVDMLMDSKKGYFDIVFMDIQMPVMNGYEATEAIRSCDREDVKNIPIIAMSANAFAEDESASLEKGMNEHIAKPIDIPKLVAALERWI